MMIVIFIHVQPLSGDIFHLIAWKWQDQFWEGVLLARSLKQLFIGLVAKIEVFTSLVWDCYPT